MKRKLPPTALVLLASILCLTQPASAQADRLPNIVFILADDLGIGDPGCYNPDSKIKTPALDRLAARGMKFADAHTPSSVCSPTRYSVLTGRYAWRSRLKQGVLWGYSRSLIEPRRTTVASLLESRGYATGCVGKWHLGFQTPDLAADDLPPANRVITGDHPHAVEYSQPLAPGPNSVGFDYFFGIPASLDMEPYLFVENTRPLAPPTEHVAASKHRRQGGGGYWRAGPMAPGFRHVDVLPELAKRATKWIADQPADQPFFLYFPLTAPHTPWVPSKSFQGRSPIGHYGDFVMQVDAVVGQVVDTLRRTGQAENTLIIVTSDNGSHWPESDIKKLGHDANMNYRGQKADIWEGGHRVPFIAAWPGRIPEGSTSDETICLCDFLATTAAIVDAPLPADAGEDSFNILPALLGQSSEKPIRPATVHHSIDGTFAIRSGPWKLIEGHLGSGGFSKPRRVEPNKLGPQVQLYNLESDPVEQHNLWENHPDVVRRLTAQLDRIRMSPRSAP